MAESDGKPASSPLSTEEADRLSEKFKPSWEAEPDPPTLPKVDPPTLPRVDAQPIPAIEPQPTKVEPQPMAKVEPQPMAKVEPQPMAKVEPQPMAKVEPQPMAKVEAQPVAKVEAQPAAKAEAPKFVGKATLLGVAVPVPSPPQAEAPNKAPDDLDWELPTNPVPSPIEEAPVIEPPPKSNPSGIGEKYIPKDTNAPAIVLKDEVKRAEERARAELAAEHRARSAPTVLKFKAVEVPKKETTDELEPSPFGPPKRRLGVWIGLGAGALSVALIGVLVLARGSGREAPTAPPEEVKAAPRAAEPEPAAPQVATPTPAPDPEPKPPEPVVAPSAEPSAVVVAPAKDSEPAPEAPKPVATAKAAPPAKAPKPVAAAPKPQPTPKPVSQPTSKPASSPKAPASKPASGGIVRDAPF